MDGSDRTEPEGATADFAGADVAVPEVAVVTGAGGWLGGSLVRTLVKRGVRVRGLVRDAGDGALLEVLGSNVEVVAGDLRDVAALDALFDGVPTAPVFHTAAVIHPVKSTREFFDVNVGGTELLLDRARRAGASRLVHVSSNSPFGANPTPTDRFTEDSAPNPYMGYGRSKLEAEEIVLRASERGDVPAVIVRAPWFYGPNQPDHRLGREPPVDGLRGQPRPGPPARAGDRRCRVPGLLDRGRRALRDDRGPRNGARGHDP